MRSNKIGSSVSKVDSQQTLKKEKQRVKTNTLQMSYSCDERGYINFVEGLIIIKRYQMLSQIGKGTFSRVMRCVDLQKSEKDENRFVALKINRNVDKYKAAAKIEYQILNAIKKIDTKDVSNCAHLLTTFDYYGH